jgi:RHS repeat-associated protein
MTLHAAYRPVRPQRPSHARKRATMRLRAGEKSCNQRLRLASEKPQPRLHCSQQYSTVALTTSSAAIAERYAYSAYGAPTVCDSSGTDIGTSTKDNRITYTGREWDDELVLYHFRARLYDAGVGRFLGRDPIGYFDGNSLYAAYFVPNMTDPSGLVCRIAYHCYNVRIPGTPIPLPARHCGLSITDDSGDYRLDGSGGPTNQIRRLPGHHPNHGPFTDFPDSKCKCLNDYIDVFNPLNIPRTHECGNSNWTLNALLTTCSLKANWGFWGEPYGYSCFPCKKWEYEYAPADPDAVVCGELTRYKVCKERWKIPPMTSPAQSSPAQ